MKSLLLFLFIPISAMETSKEVKIVCNQLSPRKHRIIHIRTRSLPLVSEEVIRDIDTDLMTTISIPTTIEKEEPKTCCTQARAVMIAAVITGSAVTTASVLTAIVTLVVHFAT
jgi:hypothetical protein